MLKQIRMKGQMAVSAMELGLQLYFIDLFLVLFCGLVFFFFSGRVL